MRKSLSFFLLFFLVSYGSWSQTDPLYAQYLNNPFLINPAYAGLSNNLNASATFRKQWAGIDGSPTTMNVNGHTSLLNNKIGAGLIVLRDQAGANENTEVYGAFAYRLDLDNKYFSFGLQGGFVSYKSNNSDLNPYDPGDPVFMGSSNVTRPSIGGGVIFHSDRYFIGLSVPRMLKVHATYDQLETQLYTQHFYLMGAYMIFLNEHIRLKPSVLLRDVKGSKLSTDLNFAVNLNENYTTGIFTRNFNTYGLLAQMKLPGGLRFGYTFEVPTNNSIGARYTTHEIMVGLSLAVFNFHDAIAVTNF